MKDRFKAPGLEHMAAFDVTNFIIRILNDEYAIERTIECLKKTDLSNYARGEQDFRLH